MSTTVDLANISNGGRDIIDLSRPMKYSIGIIGDVPILFHAWNCEAVDEKTKARKNSAAKKTDHVDSYIYRDDHGFVSVPGENIRAAIVEAGRYMQDPRSPRKSARDLVKAGIMIDEIMCPFVPHVRNFDYIDRRRVTVQRAGITRERPALRSGWKLNFTLTVLTPEYLDARAIRELLANAGRLIGLCDFRPTYGRFSVSHFDVA